MSFRARSFLVLVTLAGLVVGTTFVAVLNATHDNFVEQGSRELALGALVFDNAFESRGRELSLAVEVLARDFGFKAAVAGGDPATLQSALLNHSSRIDADLGLFIDRESGIAAASSETDDVRRGMEFPFAELLSAARTGDVTRRGVVEVDDRAVQLVVTPVFAPDLIGWAAFGFRVDDRMAAGIKRLTNLDVTFLVRRAGNARLLGSSLPGEQRDALLEASQAASQRPTPVMAGSSEALVLKRPLGRQDGVRVESLLSLPMSEVLAAYGPLRMKLLGVLIVAMLLAVVGARLLADTVARPLRRFAAAAERISRGNYRESVVAAGKDELGMLGRAINDMQSGICQRERQIVHQSRHDALTGLPNRILIAERMADAVEAADSADRPFAVLLLDMDDFKAINDTLGHAIGDAVLVEVAKRLSLACRDEDTVARLGGDEFLVLVDGATEALAREVADRILETVGDTVPVAGMQIRTCISIGVACFPKHAQTPEELQRRADISMYLAKGGDEKIAVYRAGLDEDHLRQLKLVNDLREALDNDALSLQFQPKLCLYTNEVSGVEALVRWRHPEEGNISPEEFIPLAEQSGLIRALTRRVFEKAFESHCKFLNNGKEFGISLNLSALDLLDEQLPDTVAGLLKEYAIPADMLTLEVTESAVMKDAAHAMGVMRRLRDIGVRLSIDDFGTGHSSLAQLKRLPVDELKIDKSFVMDLLKNNDDKTIVRSTIELGHNMGLSVTAEGVESPEIEQMLRQFGCDVVQGFHLSRPLPVDELIAWLQGRDTGLTGAGSEGEHDDEASNDKRYDTAVG